MTFSLRYFKGSISGKITPDRLIVGQFDARWFGFLLDPNIDVCFTFEDSTLTDLLNQFKDEVCSTEYTLIEVNEADDSFDFTDESFNRTHRNWKLHTWDVDYFQRVMRDNLTVFDDDRMRVGAFYCKGLRTTEITDPYFMKAIIRQAKIPYALQKYDSRNPEKLFAMSVNVDPEAEVGSEEVYREIWLVLKSIPNIITRIR